ncbi:hypothetical protein HBH56_012850 [Parastagonospora nodorum]|uniref:Uncharacterized protein n=1 Tax=Phaeosphaeria nodorum (strain SN15 / ATCC MYA-4574 / FGSC 10173) TaxID=321614 RepID=A0A7U2HWS3_PHANO|nr:hypothetical protein HBH56_012850 [Parastagonospora nodorum]QRC94815.1 hypothetical protein JI435_406390 [Parastagonospora nodorum SN15]KAH3937279.1 hypothetical protein HBH54_021600 [Parastagonospora nodorum]KAH4100766.1 hypothetical protein HBH46_148660 [Parastagonospora nodorum]KAH4134525.1 hypothetical protein HBH45_161550 [Parastagonospora nodorum]
MLIHQAAARSTSRCARHSLRYLRSAELRDQCIKRHRGEKVCSQACASFNASNICWQEDKHRNLDENEVQ